MSQYVVEIAALMNDPAVWASFLTLVVLEIVLGVDNVIFLSIVSSRLPEAQRRRARFIGLALALIMRVALLFSITWIIGLTEPFVTILGFGLSWRDAILIGGGAFLIYKGANEIFQDAEGTPHHGAEGTARQAAFGAIVAQIVVLDLVFSLDSVITAVGIADHIPVMVAAVVIAIAVMMIAANPIADFIEAHPSTKMLALAFLIMIGMALVADGFHFDVEKGFIYAAMLFSGFVEGLNLWALRRRRRRQAEADRAVGRLADPLAAPRGRR